MNSLTNSSQPTRFEEQAQRGRAASVHVVVEGEAVSILARRDLIGHEPYHRVGSHLCVHVEEMACGNTSALGWFAILQWFAESIWFVTTFFHPLLEC